MNLPVDFCIPKFKRYDLHAEELSLSEVHLKLDRSLTVLRRNPSQDGLRFQQFVELLRLAIEKVDSPLDCEFILNIYEGVYEDKNQRFCYTAKPNSSQILIPDSHCFETVRKVSLLDAADIPFAEKKLGASFAGSDTGRRHSNGWTMRSLVSATYKDSKLIDSKLTFLDPDTETRLAGKVKVDEIYSSPKTIQEQLSRQVILNIDGNSTSWERLLWAMASNSLCVYVKPFDGENMVSWYYPMMESLGLCPIIEYDKLEGFIESNDFSNAFWQNKNNEQKTFARSVSSIDTQASFLARVLEKYNDFYNS